MTFQVGDTVRIRRNSEHNYQRNTMGVGSIIEVKGGNGYCYRVRSLGADYTNTYKEVDLEPATPVEAPPPTPVIRVPKRWKVTL